MILNNNGILLRMKGTCSALYYYPYSFLERLGETTNLYKQDCRYLCPDSNPAPSGYE